MLRIFVMVLGLLLAGTASAADVWRVAETPHFRIMGSKSPAQLTDWAQRMETVHALLQAITGHPEPPAGAPRFEIFLVDDFADSRPYRREGVAVIAQARRDLGCMCVAIDKSDTSIRQLLFAYAHHYQLATRPAPYPCWWREGLAQYVAVTGFRARDMAIGQVEPATEFLQTYTRALAMPRLLDDGFIPDNLAERQLFSEQALLLAHYLLRTPALRRQLPAYLEAAVVSGDGIAAFRRHIDDNPNRMSDRLHRYLTREDISYYVAPYAELAMAPQISEETADAGALRQWLAATEVPPQDDAPAAATMLARARARAKAAAGEPLADRLAALAELRFGDRATAIALIDALLAAAPADPTLLRWRGEAELRAGDDQRARPWFDRALTAAPDDWRVLHELVRLGEPRRRLLDAPTLALATRAWLLAPQLPGTGLDLAAALIRADRASEARFVLASSAEPNAIAPARTQATRAWLALQRGDRAGALTILAEGLPN